MTRATLIELRRHHIAIAAALKKEIDQAGEKVGRAYCGHPLCDPLKECRHDAEYRRLTGDAR